jgi:hypothetical protein
MKLQTLAWMCMAFGVFGAPLHSQTILDFQMPGGGTITGSPGQTVGWGYTITNLDQTGTFWLSADVVSSTGNFGSGAPDSSVFDHVIVPPGASVTVTFAPNSAGLFQFTWDQSAAVGTVYSGDFLLDVTWYTGDPRACNFTCKVANPLQTEAQSSYSVTLGG